MLHCLYTVGENLAHLLNEIMPVRFLEDGEMFVTNIAFPAEVRRMDFAAALVFGGEEHYVTVVGTGGWAHGWRRFWTPRLRGL